MRIMSLSAFTLAIIGFSGMTCHAQTVSFEARNESGFFIRHQNAVGRISQINSPLDAKDATFRIVQGGLANRGGDSVSFESVNFPGFFLRHKNSKIVLERGDNTAQFAQDATFVKSLGLDGAGVSFEAVNFPGFFIRHKNFVLELNENDGSALFRRDASYVQEAPRAPQ
ncbi:AbfB domain-containing protein [Paludisphaera rhizosphaerae]|uniref:AbfB domain-containing protein n=1 Tax=Paludisphaera rhizosphaerae TaxID=2711216 RepID=UPI0013EA924A|nr:AbfB domain-containing protein [Paludisphaera rhizosphaerae]